MNEFECDSLGDSSLCCQAGGEEQKREKLLSLRQRLDDFPPSDSPGTLNIPTDQQPCMSTKQLSISTAVVMAKAIDDCLDC